MSLAEDKTKGAVYLLTLEEKTSLAKSLEPAERGTFATDEEVQAVWVRYGL